MNKRLISLVLTFIMLITMVPSTIVEASEVTTMESVKASSNQSEVTKPEKNTIYAVNPLYEDVISIDDLKKKLDAESSNKDSSNDEQLFGASTGQYFSDYDSAVLYLRKQMVSRETEINFEMFHESVFRLVCKSKIGEAVVDSARHSFSRRRALGCQLFVKHLFDELNDTILFPCYVPALVGFKRW